MKNPLIKRLPRELKSEIGKYVVLFLFITIMIGFVSGFLVANESMRIAYDESFEKYNVEDGNFELSSEADASFLEAMEEAGITLYENHYIERETDDSESTLRIFKMREEVNKVCLMEGAFPKKEKEIAIDRMYADNNGFSVGDIISVDGKELEITGLVALSDYSALFSDPSDMMFDALKFGVAVMTEDGFASFGKSGFHYSYSWKYDVTPKDDIEAKEMAEDLLEEITKKVMPENFLPMYSNQAIQFTGNDMGRDSKMFIMFLYIVVIIIAFIFAITTSNTIAKEANVIGTLRASGYTRGELVRHYLSMPMLVTFISALVGNILGYTWFKEMAADLYYGSYSLTTYVTHWNANAFIQTTVIPMILMFVINLLILVHKMQLSPLKFIRRDLSKNKHKKAVRLNSKISIMNRFRLRVILQNVPNYVMIIIGVFLANVILMFGMAMPPLLEKYEEDITSNMVCDYQYILKAPAETKAEGAEKYCAGSLKTIEGKLKSESVSVFGVIPDSKYIDIAFDKNDSEEENVDNILDKSDSAEKNVDNTLDKEEIDDTENTDEKNSDISARVVISDGFGEKFGISVGDIITLKEEYGDKEYRFKVEDTYYYPAGLAVFMSQASFNKTFDLEEDYFNGYLSDGEIEDIDDMLIGTKITVDDMTKVSRQLIHSMGGMMDMFALFGVVMFMLIVYLLSKIIIEKNAQSISMTKILGYNDGEISGLYVLATSIVTVGALILTIPIVDRIMEWVCVIMLSEFSGWLPYYVPVDTYIKMALAGIASYAVIAFIQFRRVKKVPLDVALKNVE